MPVPGTLKRMPVDENQVAGLLETQFKVRPLETRAYLKLLQGPDLTIHELAIALSLPLNETHALMEGMTASGLVIRAASSPETRFSPLHPRMTLTNVFKTYEQEVVKALRDHRTTVDRVVNLLTPIYEERKARPD
jgi:sugar-specific transcriptional regulator TrmB